VLVASALGVGALAGCGDTTDPTPTESVAPGTTVTPSHYLALVREAVAAARAADIRFAALPGGLTASQAKAAAPGLAAAAERAERAAQQLSAARLDDQRLETQRKSIAPLDVALAGSLRNAADAAQAGNVTALASAVAAASSSAAAIRAAAAPPA